MSSSSPTYIGSAHLRNAQWEVRGDFVSFDSQPFYRIAHYDAMDPFFMSIVSASDHWLFISSTGGLTAGRRNADNALFPYYAEDRIHDDADHTGSRTILRVVESGKRLLWEPFSPCHAGLYDTARNLYKSVYGNALVFEEVNHDLGLAYRYRWSPSDRFGFVKHAEIENVGGQIRVVEILDGIENLLPWGVQEAFQLRFSVLGNAYKQNELEAATGLATYAYSSLPGDGTEPAEALRATVCWSTCAPEVTRLLSSLQLDAFRRGREVHAETRMCGRRGAYFVSQTLELPAGEDRDWFIVADLEYGPSEIARLRREVFPEEKGRRALLNDVATGTRRLVGIVARADGLQSTGDRPASAHHFANVLFNVMRGGVFESAYRIDVADLKDSVRAFNRGVWTRHREFLDGLGDEIQLGDLVDAAESRGDPDLLRRVVEYLPLSFSRRHGDPSRPWNRFSIEVRDRTGSRILGYQGNWRDIFQNWEALCLSFPEYLDGVIAKFLNTTTADGYNPYRVTEDGYDWEKPDPEEPWANLGYWGDHQIVYLSRLLESSRAHHPGRLEGLLRDPRFVYADVPYDIRPYDELLADPRHSIEYDVDREARIAARVESLGFDGRYLADADGGIRRANLTEKLLVPLLAKLGNFVPGGGFWMNTQRPEWNDANNALAGYGASMVTLYHARRYVAFCLDLFEALGTEAVAMCDEVATWLEGTHAVLQEHRGLLRDDSFGDRDRKAVLDGLGTVAGAYRAGLYARGLAGERREVHPDALRDLLRTTLAFLDHSIALNRRDDGLYHAYNVLAIFPDGIAVERLYAMLEGQVAVLSSGALSSREALSVLDTLRQSDMYRDDQHTYMLYPDRTLPGFLEKNVVPASQLSRSELLTGLLAEGTLGVVERDVEGHVHFDPSFRNVGDLRAALGDLREQGYGGLVDRESALVEEIFESVFRHSSFTGRSGTFYGYEGLGCIYWHMVGKLLLAAQEVAVRAARDDREAFAALAGRYYDIRAGLGFNKSPDVFGAFPTDPYSHTPGYAGAKQPGMTGQVKEEILTRLGELGLWVNHGRIRFDPVLLRRSEFFDTAETFRYHDLRGEVETLSLDAGTLAFTYCQVPVVYRLSHDPGITLALTDGTTREIEGSVLDPVTSSEIFRRSGRIARVEVALRPGLAT